MLQYPNQGSHALAAQGHAGLGQDRGPRVQRDVESNPVRRARQPPSQPLRGYRPNRDGDGEVRSAASQHHGRVQAERAQQGGRGQARLLVRARRRVGVGARLASYFYHFFLFFLVLLVFCFVFVLVLFLFLFLFVNFARPTDVIPRTVLSDRGESAPQSKT